MKEAIQILLLITPPIAYKLYKDKDGFDHTKSNTEINFTAAIISLDCCLMNAFISPAHHVLFFLKCLAVSITGFALFFPPLFNLMWSYKMFTKKYFKNESRLRYIFTHMSDEAPPDSWEWYRKVGPFVRITIYILLFSLSIYWYVS